MLDITLNFSAIGYMSFEFLVCCERCNIYSPGKTVTALLKLVNGLPLEQLCAALLVTVLLFNN